VVHHSQEWGISQELMVETLTREGLHTWLERGISNVAYLSIALGLENVASKAFIEAKRNYVPPKKSEVLEDGGMEEEETEDEDEDEEEDSSSPSSSDSSSDSDEEDSDSFDDSDES